MISPKMMMSVVTITVEMEMMVAGLKPIVSASVILMVVARVAATIFTILFPMRIDINSESGFDFTFLRALAQIFFCFTNESTL